MIFFVKKHEGTYLDDIVDVVMWAHDNCYCSLLWAPMMVAPSFKQSIIKQVTIACYIVLGSNDGGSKL
jgi:hypothetical protein